MPPDIVVFENSVFREIGKMATIYGPLASKYTADTFEYLHVFLFAGFYDAHDVAIQFTATFFSKTA